ncbi:MAG TPA: hypothetical protein VNS60_04170 [Solirubrobacterales bacterium]|nr:hypothetical protein [Solirubrobacterales bacterium]
MLPRASIKQVLPVVPPQNVSAPLATKEPVVAHPSDYSVLGSRSARNEVVAQSSISEIALAIASDDPVVTPVAADEIDPSTSKEHVASVSPLEMIGSGSGFDPIASASAHDPVVPSTRADPVIATASVYDLVSIPRDDHVWGRGSFDVSLVGAGEDGCLLAQTKGAFRTALTGAHENGA